MVLVVGMEANHRAAVVRRGECKWQSGRKHARELLYFDCFDLFCWKDGLVEQSNWEALHVEGYAQIGDDGDATTCDEHPRCSRAASSLPTERGWEIAVSLLRFAMLGAMGDAYTDDSAAIQETVNVAPRQENSH